MERNRFPHQIGLWLRNAVPSEKFAGCVRAINLKSLRRRVIMVDEAEIVKQRRDIEQLGIELQILAKSLHRSEHIDANRMVEQHLGLVTAHQFCGLSRQ